VTRFCSRTSGDLSPLCAEGALQQGSSGEIPAQWGHYYEVSVLLLRWLINFMCRCIHRLLDSLTSEEVYSAFVQLPTCDAPIPPKIHGSS
jgi:hypothetical protein